MTTIKQECPRKLQLIVPVLKALIALNRAAPTNEIYNQVISQENYSDEILGVMHESKGKTTGCTVVRYELGWALTHLKGAGYISRSANNMWVVRNDLEDSDIDLVDPSEVERVYRETRKKSVSDTSEIQVDEEDEVEKEVCPEWKDELRECIMAMDCYEFESLVSDLCRAMGYIEPKPTRKSGDKGIDVKAWWGIGLYQECHQFQCKQYALDRNVTDDEMRTFKGSLNKNCKGVYVTMSDYTKPAKDTAEEAGIRLISGDEFLELLNSYNVGMTRSVNKSYFAKFKQKK